MKTKRFLMALFVFTLALSACSRDENATKAVQTDTPATTKIQTPFLTPREIPKVEVTKGGEDGIEIFVRLINRAGESVENWVASDPNREDPSFVKAFYTKACGKEALILVLHQGVNTGVSAGSHFFNVLIDPVTGDWITTFSAGEVRDKETGEIISDDQKAVLVKLKAGITQHCPEILDPNHADTGKNKEWLLQ
ncbi:MAG: hypothetical protein K6T56_12515 [Burkholderiales bacterium]|nr:hypothetical protein [Burkholderiales bacterium]